MADALTVGSLFSGTGGLDHGLTRAGFRHAFFCESDEWRRSVLAHRWPGVPIYEDVRNISREAVEEAHAGSSRRGGGAVSRGLVMSGARESLRRESSVNVGSPAAPYDDAAKGGDAIGSHAGIDLLCGGFP